MNKYSVCILAHQKPSLLQKITESINYDNVEIFIHLDARCNMSDFLHINNVTFINKRVKVEWGGRSMVRAMINLIDYVVANTRSDYIIFISGEDLPIIKPNQYDNYVDIKKNYIEYEKLPKTNWFLGGMERVKYYYPFRSAKGKLNRIFLKVQKIFRIGRNIDAIKFTLYGGSQWINISREAATFILNNYKEYYRFFKLCYIPDEMFFQTVLLNSYLKDTVINKNYRYLRYQNNGSNAAYLDESDITNIIEEKPLFCRKIPDERSYKNLKSAISILLGEK